VAKVDWKRRFSKCMPSRRLSSYAALVASYNNNNALYKVGVFGRVASRKCMHSRRLSSYAALVASYNNNNTKVSKFGGAELLTMHVPSLRPNLYAAFVVTVTAIKKKKNDLW
jgi:hypothetical protein